MPKASEINDYGIFDNPRWYQDEQKSTKFTL